MCSCFFQLNVRLLVIRHLVSGWGNDSHHSWAQDSRSCSVGQEAFLVFVLSCRPPGQKILSCAHLWLTHRSAVGAMDTSLRPPCNYSHGSVRCIPISSIRIDDYFVGFRQKMCLFWLCALITTRPILLQKSTDQNTMVFWLLIRKSFVVELNDFDGIKQENVKTITLVKH